MSYLMTDVRLRVQTKLREIGLREKSRDVIDYDDAIADASTMLLSRLPAPELYTDNAGTITAGALSFDLPSDEPTADASKAQYLAAPRIQLVSTGQFLEKLSSDEIDALRSGYPTPPPGRPKFYSLEEAWQDQDLNRALTTTCQVHPVAQQDETYNLWRRIHPDRLRDSNEIDAARFSMSEIGVTALVLKSCLCIGEGLTKEDFQARQLNDRVLLRWEKECNLLLYQEEKRRHNLAATGRIQRRD